MTRLGAVRTGIWLAAIGSLLPLQLATAAEPKEAIPSVDQQLAEDGALAYWTFDGGDPLRSAGALKLKAKQHGAVQFTTSDLKPPFYLLHLETNHAAQFQTGSLRIPDSDSRLDFSNGDEITLEAFVQAHGVENGKHVYLIGKGRTLNEGVRGENQNYALRLTGAGGAAQVSFLFRNENNKSRDDFHRWTSKTGFVPDGRWHHVAVTYRFGEAESIRGYVDGKPVQGAWDMGGPTATAPWVDDDEIWIGSTMGGSPQASLRGGLDSVAIHRRAISAERMSQRYRALAPPPFDLVLAKAQTPAGQVLGSIHEGVPDQSWASPMRAADRAFTLGAVAADRTPSKYDAFGQLTERSNPFRLHLQTIRTLPAGEYRILLRARNATRLYIDEDKVAELGFMNRNSSGHEEVPQLSESEGDAHAAPPGHQETVVTIALDGRSRLWRVETVVGGKGLRAELGELAVAIASRDAPFQLLTPDESPEIAFDEAGWSRYQLELVQRTEQLNASERLAKTSGVREYWSKRHQEARGYVSSLPAIDVSAPSNYPRRNRVDDFVNARLAAGAVKPEPLTDDDAFLRRATLDVAGRNPTAEEMDAFASDSSPSRRSTVIDRLLEDRGWADNWMGYWQDVLAENPGILKPKLNNTGPFRWWLYESFLDNKSMDRLATELIMMRGSVYAGGPAGFALATQNDVPMAAKAHVLSQAFLGIEMKCARCHDAPFHPHKQKQLFSIAAMLQKQQLTLPETSSVPDSEGGRLSLIEVSLRPGEKIDPHWPFANLVDDVDVQSLLRSSKDSRERLAALITSPKNRRFAQVMANRLWARYMGWGLVHPVDDWHDAEPSHPLLLDYLGRELTASGYDLKHVARLILNSHAYQRVAGGEGVGDEPSPKDRLFASPKRRRLTAEQIVDSLLYSAGKPMASEPLTLDPEGRRAASTFLNLGVPTRAWQLTSLSNERDRPALALPTAQSVVDVLITFGWRDSRPSPLSIRDETPTILQPLTVANGILGARVSRLSDDSRFTELALAAETPDEFVEQLFREMLSRPPTTEEREPLASLLRPGFDSRRTGAPKQSIRRMRHAVSWSNHLNAEATRIKNALEKQVREGDPPTARLVLDWRERAEDVIWAIMNSPEFVFVP